MPDITMCTGKGCPRRDECYRARAVPSKYMQSYFSTPPVDAAGKCTYHMKIMQGDRLAPLVTDTKETK